MTRIRRAARFLAHWWHGQVTPQNLPRPGGSPPVWSGPGQPQTAREAMAAAIYAPGYLDTTPPPEPRPVVLSAPRVCAGRIVRCTPESHARPAWVRGALAA